MLNHMRQWLIDLLCPTNLAGKASAKASREHQGDMEMPCEFQVEVVVGNY